MFVICISTWQSKTQSPNVPMFILLDSIWPILISGLLEVQRMNQSCVGAELYELHLWTSMVILLSATSLSFLADEGRKSKKYLQLFQMILGLVWLRIMLPVKLQPVYFSRVFCVILIPQSQYEKGKMTLGKRLVSLNNPKKY